MGKIISWLTSGKPLVSVLVIVLALVLLQLLKFFFTKIPKNGYNDTLRGLLMDFLRGLILVVALIFLLSVNGVDVTSLITGLGLVGVIVGLALQDWLKDIIMGMHILNDGFYKVGDAVVYEDNDCIVTDFTLKTTKLRVIDNGASIVLCNRNVEKIRRISNLVDIKVPLGYGEDLNKIRKVMAETAEKISNIDNVDGAVFKGTESFGDSAVNYLIRFYSEPSKQPECKRIALGIIQDELSKNGIEIPFNQLDVHMIENK